MKRFWLIFVFLIVVNSQTQISSVYNPDDSSKIKSSIEIYPTNLKTQTFTLFHAQPYDGCTQLDEPKIQKNAAYEKNPYIVVVDGDSGFCGFKRRIAMVKQIGAKGIIIVSENLQYAIDPYGEYSDRSFFVFIAKPQNKSILQPKRFSVVRISSADKKDISTNYEIELWVSSLDKNSYELMKMWQQTLKQIPAISKRVNWRPRFSLWGCNSGIFNNQSSCANNSASYIATCACAGQFCSPQTDYKAADAIVREDIRQKIIFQYFKEQYMQYVLGFYKNCFQQFKKQLYTQCPGNLLMNLKIDHITIEQKIDNFMSQCKGDIYDSLKLDRNRFSQISSYPSVFVDRQNIKYSGKRDFQNQICQKLSLNKEQGCIKISTYTRIINITVNILFYIVVIAGIAGIVFGLFFVYRKKIRKQMQKQMKMQVSASVEHYFALTQTK